MKLRNKKARKRAQVGRPAKIGVPRHPGGKIVQRTTSEREADIKATVVAQRVKFLGMSKEEALRDEAGSVVGRLGLMTQRGGGLSKEQVAAATHIARVKSSSDAALLVKRIRSASDHSGGGRGVGQEDPEREAEAILAWKVLRREIMLAGSFCLFAVEALVFEDKDIPQLVGDLRLALNAVHRMRAGDLAA